MLSSETVSAYLRGRGLLAKDSPARVQPLGGGVSSVIFLVQADGARIVVKQALGRLRVADGWFAKPERVLTEGDALKLTGEITPRAVPAVLQVDAAAHVLVLEAAPPSWRPWKALLLEGKAEPGIAARLGEVLRRWHSATAESAEVHARFADYEAFEQLRVDPYYRTILQRHPVLAGPIRRTIESMLARHVCLVHADFSPKNVLVGSDDLWVIDHECAHFGDPAFDVAFLLNHLLLKTIHRPAFASRYEACARAFIDAYGIEGTECDIVDHLGCQLLARVDGKSPTEYLSGDERETGRRVAYRLIRDSGNDLLALWSLPELSQ